jgi:hypothetical protein
MTSLNDLDYILAKLCCRGVLILSIAITLFFAIDYGLTGWSRRRWLRVKRLFDRVAIDFTRSVADVLAIGFVVGCGEVGAVVDAA